MEIKRELLLLRKALRPQVIHRFHAFVFSVPIILLSGVCGNPHPNPHVNFAWLAQTKKISLFIGRGSRFVIASA